MMSRHAKLTIEIARIGAFGVALLMLTVLVVTRSQAAFSDTTANSANSFSTGTVDINDDDSGSAMFTASAMSPGTPIVKCLTVTYAGTLTPADVRMYGTSSGALAPYLTTTIEIGSGGSFADCAGFTPSSTIYSGTLSNFSTTYTNWASGLAAYTANSNPTARTLKFTVDVQNTTAAQGQSATATFTFEAQN